MKKMCFFISVLAAVLCSLSTFAATAENSRPFVIPELKTWEAGKGDLTISGTMRIAVPSGDGELLRIAGMLAEDWNTVAGFRPEIVTEKGGKGDIVLEIKADKKLNKLSGGSTGSYSLDITDRVRLSASTARGVYWGTQTLLQMADRALQADAETGSIELACGRILDWPDYGIRGFMMDCGRKYIPMSYLRKLSRIMAYYKMNTLQIHLNDNGFKQYFGGDWASSSTSEGTGTAPTPHSALSATPIPDLPPVTAIIPRPSSSTSRRRLQACMWRSSPRSTCPPIP